jgi:hypothetical protein
LVFKNCNYKFLKKSYTLVLAKVEIKKKCLNK